MNSPESFTPQNDEATEQKPETRNPNNIGELLAIGSKDVPTSPDKVYRSVAGERAIDDIFESGVVRNAFSAGVKKHARWGDKVFWSRGKDGSHHSIQEDGHIIEAPYDVASARQVTEEDLTGIYKKTAEGVVQNIIDQKRIDKQAKKTAPERNDEDERRLAQLRQELGLQNERNT